MALTILAGGHWPAELESLLNELPEWFGIEASVRTYVDAARTLPAVAARLHDEIVGVCVVRRHNAATVEIEVLAVRRDLHRSGIGRQLMDRVEADARASGAQLLEVKTRGPSAFSEEYARTRAFYAALGFLPVEERTDIWGPENPCLISVKPLA